MPGPPAAYRIGPIADRLAAAVVLVAAVAVVAVLAWVTPDPRGYGTHEQLGLTACGWAESAGTPCPTCGVTTAAALLVHGAPLDALAAQPFGALLALGGIALGLLAAWSLLGGGLFVARLERLPYGTIAVASVVVFFASWLYKHLTFSP